jgi:hypothetical protein
MSCYRQALAFARERTYSMARRFLVVVLADFGDACRAAGDLPTAAGAWQEARQILDDLRLPDLLGVGARLERASPATHPG